MLDLIEMGDINPLAMLTTVLPKVYSGGHVHHRKVRVSRGTSFRFEAVVDLDGETVGRLPLDVSVVPRGFRIGTVGPDKWVNNPDTTIHRCAHNRGTVFALSFR